MAAPSRIGDYELLKPIGKGKFAIVYRARRLSDGETVALKRINVDTIDDKAREKCLKEVQLLQSLDHPNVIKYLDSFITDNDLVIVVEWAAAGDLKRQLRKAQERGVGFEERVIWKYFAQMSSAMQHLRERRIMHRDLKPANIFLTLDGTVKVGDLGLSRELSEHTVQAHSKVGTPLYMSPEVLRGDGYDFKSDIWSLGCLLYELAMLKSPFKSEGLNLYSLFQKISQGDFQPLPENYSEELRSLAYSMISTKSEDRPDISEVVKISTRMRAITGERHLSAKRAAAKALEDGASGGATTENKQERDNSSSSTVSSKGETPRQEEMIRSDSKESESRKAQNQREDQQQSQRRFQDPSVSARAEGKRDSVDEGEPQSPEDDGGRDSRREMKRQSSSQSLGAKKTSALVGSVDPIVTYKLSNTESNTNNSSKSFGGEAVNRTESSKWDGKETNAPPAQSQWRQQSSNQQDHRTTNTVTYDAPSSSLASNRQKSKAATGWDAPEYDDIARTVSTNPYGMANANASHSSPEGNSSRPEKIAPYSRPKSDFSSTSGSSSATGSASGGSQRQGKFTTAASSAVPTNNTASFRDDDLDLFDDDATKKKDNNKLKNSSVASALMDVLFAKLIALQCPLNDPSMERGKGMLLPFHFAVDLSTMGKIAGLGDSKSSGLNTFTQFRRMVFIAQWLFSRLGSQASDAASRIDIDNDTPMTISKQLLNCSSIAGVSPEDLADVQPSALMLGHGEKVCEFLLALADRLLKVSNFKPLPLVRKDEEENMGGVGKAGRNNDKLGDSTSSTDEVAETSADQVEEAGADEDLRDNTPLEASMGDNSGLLGNSMVVACIDPALWREETARVGPQLLAARRNYSIGDGGWSDHLQTMKEYATGWISEDANAGSSSKGGDIQGNMKDKVAKNEMQQNNPSLILSQLSGVHKEVRDTLSDLQRAESMLGTRQVYSALCSDFGNSRKTLLELQDRRGQLSQRMEELTAKLSAIEESADELSEKLAQLGGSTSTSTNKSGEGGGGEGSSVSGAMVRMKEAIRRVKQDNMNMSVQIGLLSSTLLAKRLGKMIQNRKKNQEKRRRKIRGLGGKPYNNGDDDDDNDNDEDFD